MPQRIRKLVGGVAILAFLAAYIVTAITLAAFVPNLWPVKLIYFLVVGMAWGAPLLPLLAWMNRGR